MPNYAENIPRKRSQIAHLHCLLLLNAPKYSQIAPKCSQIAQ